MFSSLFEPGLFSGFTSLFQRTMRVYVSNTANNGYGLGNDSTGDGSKSAPYLTISKALSVATTGAVVTVNPSGSTYAESTGGAGYLNITQSGIAIETDPALVVSVGKATVSATSSSYVVLLNLAGGRHTLRNLKIDCATTTKNAVRFNAANANILLYGIDVLNAASGCHAFINYADANRIDITRCSQLTANGNNSNTNMFVLNSGGTNVSLTMHANQFDCSSFTTSTGVGFVMNRMVVTGNSITGGGSNIVRVPNGSSANYVEINGNAFSGIGSGKVCITNNGSVAATVASLRIQNNTFTSIDGTCIQLLNQVGAGDISSNTKVSGAGGFLKTQNIGVTNLSVHDNTITTTGTTTAGSDIDMQNCGAGCKVYRNTITSAQTAHVIQIGVDGQQFAVSNTATSTGGKGVGNNSLVYVAQPFTFYNPTPNGSTNSKKVCSFAVQAKKAGSSTGRVAAYIYADSGGYPDQSVILATSDYELDTSELTSSYQWVEFWFSELPSLDYNTTYHLVLKWLDAVDAVNYVDFAANTSFAQKYSGSATGTPASGSSWFPSATNALLFKVGVGAYEAVAPEMYDNVVTLTAAGTPITHCCFMGSTTGGKIYRNKVYNGALSLLFKLVDGVTSPALCYDNVVYATLSGVTMYDKGSTGAKFYQNTVISSAGANMCQLGADFQSGYFNGKASIDAEVKNNIFYRTADGNYVFVLGTIGQEQPTVVNPTIDYNLSYFGGTTKMALDNRTGSGVDVTTFAALQALGFETHGVFDLPDLVSATPATVSDFAPQVGSPAYGMGDDLTATVPTDITGAAFTVPVTVGAIAG